MLYAVGKLKNGKAGGESGILPEMVKAACCEPEFLDRLVQDGANPQKGRPYSCCDNWRGISLL